jgi:hypothetical protein
MNMSRNVGLVAVVLVAWILPMQVSAQEDSARAYYFVGGVPSVPSVLPDEPLAPETTIFGGGDGSYESGFNYADGSEMVFVQFFQFPSENGRLLAFEACFFSFVGEVDDFQYNFKLFAAPGGENQEPGTEIDSGVSGPFTVGEGLNNLTCYVLNFTFIHLDVSEHIYLGVSWDGEYFPTVLVAVDTNGDSSGAGWGRGSGDWESLAQTPEFAAYRNLGIRTAWTSSEIFSDGFESGDTSAWSDTMP